MDVKLVLHCIQTKGLVGEFLPYIVWWVFPCILQQYLVSLVLPNIHQHIRLCDAWNPSLEKIHSSRLIRCLFIKLKALLGSPECCLAVCFAVFFFLPIIPLEMVMRVPASLSLAKSDVLENFRYGHVIVLDPAPVVIGVVRVAGNSLFYIAEVVAAVEGAAVAQNRM